MVRLALVLSVVLFASACGGGDGGDGGDADPGATGDETETGGDADSGGGEAGETIRLTLGAGHPAGGAITYTNYSESFFVPEATNCVSEETDHELEINEAYGGAIAPLGEILEATRDGLLDIGLVPFPFEPSELFLQNMAYYVPFSSPDVNVTLEAFRGAAEENPIVLTMFEEEFNQKLLGLAAVGDYGLVTTFPWDDVSELSGRKITAAGPNLPWIEPVGAVPVQGNLNEWYTSLQTGVVDGAIMFPEAAAGFKLHEPAPNYKQTHFGAIAVGSININLDTLEELPEDVAACIEEAAAAYEAGIGDEIAKDLEAALETMEAEGAEVTELSDAQRQEWADALPNLPAERAQEGEDMGVPAAAVISAYIQAMEDAGYDFPRKWEVGG